MCGVTGRSQAQTAKVRPPRGPVKRPENAAPFRRCRSTGSDFLQRRRLPALNSNPDLLIAVSSFQGHRSTRTDQAVNLAPFKEEEVRPNMHTDSRSNGSSLG